jgi:O-antigen/teichoic acid export membrane protein
MVTGWGVTLALPIALLAFVVPEAFLALFGAQYLEGASALRILLVAALINVGIGSVGTTLLATGETRTYLKINLIGTGLGFSLSLILVSTFGLLGAALGQLATAALWNGLSLWVVYRMYRMQPFSRQYLYVFLAGAASLLVLLPGILWVLDLSRWAILAVAPIHLGLTLALLWKLRLLDPETRATVSAVLDSLWGRLGTMHPLFGVRK